MKLNTRFLQSATFLIISTSALAQSTWNTTDGSWNTAGNWTPSGVPASATTTQLVFNASGSTSYTTTNNIGARNLNKITVNNTGSGTVTIAASSTSNTLTFAGTTPTLDITGIALFTGRMAGSATVTKTGTGTFIHDSDNSGFTGTLNVNNGTFINRSTTFATTNFNPTLIVVNNGGTYQFGVNGVGNPNLPNGTYITVNSGGLVVWEEGENFGGLNLQGGTIDLEQGGANCVGTTAQSWTSGTLTGSGSSAFTVSDTAAINKTTSGTVNITGNASIASSGGLNIQEGIIAMAGSGNLGTANVALGAASTSGTFEYQGTTASRGGTFAVSAGGGVIGVTNAAANLTLSGALSGSGPVSKTGAGTLSLSGALGGTGLTTVNAGSLRVNPVIASGGFASATGTSLIINTGAASASFTTPTLNLSATSTLLFELNTASLSSTPMVVVSTVDGLTSAGTPTLRLTNQQSFANGTYTLINYDGTAITSGYSLSLPGRTIGALVYDTANTEIDLSISGTDTVKWNGGLNSTWDAGSAPNVGGTQNLQLVTGGTATNFIDTDTVLFDDTASNFTVELATSVLPFATSVDASNDYLFSGSGKISGATGLTKSGTGKLTLATNNDYSGATTINAGILEIGNGGTTGSFGTGAISIATGATLRYNQSDTTTFTAFSGSGTLEVEGGGTLVLQGTGHSGNVTINSGTMRPGTVDNSLIGATATVTIGASGTLDLGGFNEGFGSLTGTGTLTNSVAATTAAVGVTPTSDTVFDGLIVDGSGKVAFDKSGTFNLRLTNPGNTFSGTQTFGNRAIPVTIELNAGGLEFTSNAALGVAGGDIYLNGGDALVDKLIFGADSITLDTGRQLNIDTHIGFDTQAFTGTIAGAILGDDNNGSLIGSNDSFRKLGSGTLILTGTMNQVDEAFVDAGTLRAESTLDLARITVASGATLQFGNDNATGDINGSTATVVNNGTVKFNRTGTVTLDHLVSGTGSLEQNGSGSVITLSANNTYLGNTTVSAGKLVVNGVQNTATGAVSVAAGASLGGSGTVGGATTITGSHTPGNSVGTQTFSGDLSYALPASIFSWELADEVVGARGADYDAVNVGGALNINDSTFHATVTGLDVTQAFWDANRSWNVFNATSVTGTFATFQLFDASAPSTPVSFAAEGVFTLTNTGTLNWTAVPEASNALIGVLLSFALLRRRRNA